MNDNNEKELIRWLIEGDEESYTILITTYGILRGRTLILFTRSLDLKTRSDWIAYTKSGQLPDDIPRYPSETYLYKGWSGIGDWLGTGNLSNRQRKFRSFKDAREFVRILGLKSGTEWREYCRTAKLPNDIPSNPHRTYRDKGWAGMGDWLGTGNIGPMDRKYRTFEEARKFARGLGLKSSVEWAEFSKSGERPMDIPSNPGKNYKNEGWSGYRDWLGN